MTDGVSAVLRARRASASARLAWSAEALRALVELRGDGASWDEVGRKLGVARTAATAVARQMGLQTGRPARVRLPPATNAQAPDLRDPLAAGHPLSWSLLLALTPSLEGTPFRREPFRQGG